MATLTLGARRWHCNSRVKRIVCAFRACEQTVPLKCVLSVGVLSTPSVDFLEFLPENRNHNHFSDNHEQLPLRNWRWRLCRRVSPWLSVVPPSSLAIDISSRRFLLLRIADFVVDAVDVVDVSVSEFDQFPPGEHLAFSGIVSVHRQILIAVEQVFGAHQHSNEEPNVWLSVFVQLV